jgi:hypothetical protein
MMHHWLRKWRDMRRAWGGYAEFKALPHVARRIVFYAESEADWAYIGPLADELQRRGKPLARVTSDPTDPVLQRSGAFYIGSGGARTVLFRTVDADAFVLTLTDLDSFHLKRSAHAVHYFYVFHSIASTHRVYREHAFDAYDTVLCVGPHHFSEIRRTEEVYGLRPKKLAAHGYARLDTLIEAAGTRTATAPRTTLQRVLIAPSWGECSLVNHGLERLLRILLRAGFHVTLRLHPMTQRHMPQLTDQLYLAHQSSGRFRIDPHINQSDSLLEADIMISEWSGAPLEYAFARERPVIFIDTPPKVHNPNHDRIGLPCLEVDIREQIGRLVPLDRLDALPEIICALVEEPDQWGEKIRSVREASVFNVGKSAQAGADVILETLAHQGESTHAESITQPGR